MKITWENGNPKNEKSKKKNHMRKKPKKELKTGENLNPHKPN
jgi:hypothetical protein